MNKKMKCLLKTTIFSTVSIHIANRVMNHLSTSQNILTTVQGHQYAWKEGNIFYTKTGEGEPLLLVHHLFPDSSSYEWKQVVKELAHHYTVYAIDLVGCGRSAKPGILYTNYFYVQLLQDFIKHVIKQPTNLVVSKASASFGISQCCMNPDQVKKLILVNPDPISHSTALLSKRAQLRKYLLRLPIIGTFLYNLDMQHAVEKLKFRLRFWGQTNPHPEEWAWAYTESAYLNNSKGKHLLSSIENKMINSNIIHTISILHTPTMIIGSRDNEFIDETITQFQELNEHIDSITIYGSKYLPQIDSPKQFCDCVHHYLSN